MSLFLNLRSEGLLLWIKHFLFVEKGKHGSRKSQVNLVGLRGCLSDFVSNQNRIW